MRWEDTKIPQSFSSKMPAPFTARGPMFSVEFRRVNSRIDRCLRVDVVIDPYKARSDLVGNDPCVVPNFTRNVASAFPYKLTAKQKREGFPSRLAFNLIPNPTEKNNYDYPLPPVVADLNLTGIGYNVAVFIGYGAGNCCIACFTCCHFTVCIYRCDSAV